MAATHVQSIAGTAATSGKVASAQFASNVTTGNLLIAAVSRTVTGENSPAVTITDDRGNAWKQAGEGVVLGTPYGTGYDHGLDIWYCESALPAAVGGGPPSFTASAWGAVLADFDFSDTSTITDAGGGAVSQVTAKSGSKPTTIAQGTPANRPTTGTRQSPNGLNTLDFDGANDLLIGDPADEAQPYTIVAVFKSDTTDGGAVNRQAASSGAGGTLYMRASAGSNWRYYAGVEIDSGVAVNTAWHVMVGIFNGASSQLYLDGSLIASGITPGTNAVAFYCVGSDNTNVAPWDGQIGQVIWYDNAVADPAGLSAALTARWTTGGAGNRPTVTATLQGYPNGVMSRMVVAVMEYGGGAGGFEPWETSGVVATTGTTATATTRDSCSANDLLLSMVVHNGSAATVPAGWNSRFNDTVTDYAIADLLDSGASGAKSAAWTGLTSNTKGFAIIIGFKPGGTRASNAIRCVRQQYRLEELFSSSTPLGIAQSPAFVAPAVDNSLILFTSPYVGNNVVEVTDDHGNQWEQLFDGGFDTWGDGECSLWIARRCQGTFATITITVTMSQGQGSTLWNETLYVLMEYQGLPADADVIASGVVLSDLGSGGVGTTAPSVTTTASTPASSTLVLGFLSGGAEVFGTLSNGAGWLTRFTDSGAEIGVVEKVTSTPATQTASWTYAVAQVANYFVVALGSRSVSASGVIATQRRVAIVAPQLPQQIGQRAETVEWQVLESDMSVIGLVNPVGERASVRHDVGSDIIRTVDNLALSEADCEDMNMLTTRIQPVWVMDDLSRWPLGVFMFSAADRHPRSLPGASTRTMSLYDQNTLLLDKRREAFGLVRGASLRNAMVQLVEECHIPLYTIAATGAVAGDDLGYPPATPRLRILRHLCALAGLLRPYFDNTGTLIIRSSPDLDSVEPDISYDTGPSSRIHVESIVTAKDLFDVPNIYLVTGSGATESQVSAYALVPSSMPHSVQNIGREKVEEISLNGVADSNAAFVVAQAAAAQRVNDFSTYEFEGAPDPRHDTFNIVGVDSVNYREVSWDLPLEQGAHHKHSLREVYSLVQNANETAPTGVGSIKP